MSMRRIQSLALAVVLISAPATGRAQELRQERLFAIVPVSPDAAVSLRKIVEIDTSASNVGAVFREWPLTVEPPDFAGGLHPLVGGGRYLVWVSGIFPGFPFPMRPIHLNVFDTSSGTARAFENVVDGPIIAVDNHAGRVFLAERRHIAIVDARTGTIARFPHGSPAFYRLPMPAAYAEDVNRLFMQSLRDGSVVDVFDVASGTVVQSISTGSTIFGLATDPAGSRLYTIQSGFAGVAVVSAHDTSSGILVARTSLLREDTRYDHRMQFDPGYRRLLVGSLVVFDADTLSRLGGVHGACAGDPECRDRGPRFTFVGPRSPLLFFTSKAAFHYGSRSCVSAPLEARHPISGQLLRIADLSWLANRTALEWGGCVIDMEMATVPRAPRALISEVQERRVRLSWIDPGNTTHFQVEAGLAPGAANLYQQAVGGTSLTIGDVPPGTYYVRVRAVNAVGRSLPVEIAILVP